MKKKPTRKKKAPTTTDDCDKKHPTSFGPEELLLVTKAFMKVSSNAKHSTDKTREKFWEDIHIHYDKLVTTSNEINESNAEYIQLNAATWSHYAIAGREDSHLLFKKLQGL